MKRKPKPNGRDPNQAEFVIVWQLEENPFRLRAGDVFRSEDGRLCRVVRVTACAAVIIVNQPTRAFKTRFDKPVKFQPPPKLTRMSPNAEVEVLNRHVA